MYIRMNVCMFDKLKIILNESLKLRVALFVVAHCSFWFVLNNGKGTLLEVPLSLC